MAGAGKGDTGEMRVEDVSSTLRSETGTKALTPVRKDIYPAIAALVANIEKEYQNSITSDEFSLVTEGWKTRRSKVMSESKRIAEARMSKICSLAIRNTLGARSPIDTLTPEETEFYDTVYDAIMKVWGALEHKKTVTIPDIAPEVEESPGKPQTAEEPAIPEAQTETPVPEEAEVPKTAVPAEATGDDCPLSEMPFIDDGPEPQENEPEIDDEDRFVPPQEREESAEVPEDPFATGEMSVIMITEHVPPFAGPERDYVLRKGDVVKMPKAMADILIGGNMAMQIRCG